MRALLLIVALAASACVLASDHVSTELHAVCTEDVPLPFRRVAAGRAVAEVEVDDVGASVDAPEAHATLDVMTLEAGRGIDDFAFADSMAMDLLAPGREDARVAALDPMPPAATVSADGDRDVDLVDYLTSDRLTVRIALTGDIPADGFLATFSACIDVEGIAVED
ncbi:MAG TPA: hypothetical protein VFU21_29025 [Kofleriaceae bacterium]|nr:hypothetical protein [Kofleriaceae bacterium]